MAAANRDIVGSRAFRVGLAQAIVATVLGLALAKLARPFQNIYADFGTALPAATNMLLTLLSRYWYLCFLPLCLWPFVYSGVASLLSRRPEAVIPGRVWLWATWIVMLLLVVLALVALIGPLFTLITSLSSGPASPAPLSP